MQLAHSADAKRGIPVQSYADHVDGVVKLASRAAANVSKYSINNGELLCEVVRRAAEFHDLGKLDIEKQDVLNGMIKARHLPVQHTDAGTAFLLSGEGTALDAVLVRSHHIGLPDWQAEYNRGDALFRDENEKIRQRVDQ